MIAELTVFRNIPYWRFIGFWTCWMGFVPWTESNMNTADELDSPDNCHTTCNLWNPHSFFLPCLSVELNSFEPHLSQYMNSTIVLEKAPSPYLHLIFYEPMLLFPTQKAFPKSLFLAFLPNCYFPFNYYRFLIKINHSILLSLLSSLTPTSNTSKLFLPRFLMTHLKARSILRC